MVYLMPLPTSWISPKFRGKKDDLSAVKLVTFSAIAAWAGGIFGLFPTLSLLQTIAAFYGLYLFYLGLPVLMQCPVEKAPMTTGAIAIAAIISWFVISRVIL